MRISSATGSITPRTPRAEQRRRGSATPEELPGDLDALDDKVNEVSQALTTTTGRVDGLSDELDDLDEDITTLRSDVEGRLDPLETDVATLQDDTLLVVTRANATREASGWASDECQLSTGQLRNPATCYIHFDEVPIDTAGAVASGSTPWRWTAPVDGLYQITATANIARTSGVIYLRYPTISLTDDDGIRRATGSRFIGAESIESQSESWSMREAPLLVTSILELSEGDVVRVQVRHGHRFSNVIETEHSPPTFQAVRLGPR